MAGPGAALHGTARLGKDEDGDLKITWLPPSVCVPYEDNPRLISTEAVAKVAESIRQFGFRQPIVVDEAMIILAGHTRKAAAELLGMERVPVHVAKGLSPAQARAFRIADNKVAEFSEWDASKLKAELLAIQAGGEIELPALGFDDGELLKILTGGAGREDAEIAPEPPTNPVSRLGDLWLLGRHRVLCGDATSADDVARLLAGARPNLMVTDPPYGVEYKPDWRASKRRSDGRLLSAGKHSMGRVTNDERADWREAWALFPGCVAYVWHAGLQSRAAFESLEAERFEIRAQIIWNKNVMVIGRGHYHFKHEPCWYAVRKGGDARWSKARDQTTVWDIPIVHRTAGNDDDGRSSHGTQKPVECMRRPMLNNSKPGDLVYDPFLGSGTSVIAAQMEGRICLGLELSPAYVDVIVKRWEKFTGEHAILEGDGVRFEEVAEMRGLVAA